MVKKKAESGDGDSAMEEEKKEEDPANVEVKEEDGDKVNYEALSKKIISSKPWRKLLNDENSASSKMLKAALWNPKTNLTAQSALAQMCKMLTGQEDNLDAEDILGGESCDKTMILAILVQNSLHPKNSHRVDAIKANKYSEIKNVEEAEAFLSELLEDKVLKELLSVESEVQAQFAALASQ